jgi:hypothetical protein
MAWRRSARTARNSSTCRPRCSPKRLCGQDRAEAPLGPPSRRSKARGGDGAGHGQDDLDAAEKLLASPHATKERARLKVLIVREADGLDAGDWQRLTSTFSYDSGDTKAELDEIIARSRELW